MPQAAHEPLEGGFSVFYGWPLLASLLLTVVGWICGVASVAAFPEFLDGPDPPHPIFDLVPIAVSIMACFALGPICLKRFSLRLRISDEEVRVSEWFGLYVHAHPRRGVLVCERTPLGGIAQVARIRLPNRHEVTILSFAANYERAVQALCVV